MNKKDVINTIEEYIQQGLIQEAEEIVSQYKQMFQYDDEIASIEAIISIYNKKYEYGLSCVREGLKYNIYSSDLYYTMGNIYELQGKFNRAYLCYEHAINCNTNEDNTPIMQEAIKNLKDNCKIDVNRYSVIILTHNNLDYTKICVNSIRKFNSNSEYEIIIVDNNSTDGTDQWIKDQIDIKYILNDENKGFPVGCNQGIEIAEKNNDIFLLNNDTVIMPNSIFNLRMALYSDEKIGATGAVSNNASYYQKINETYEEFDDYMNLALKNNISNESLYEERLKLVGFAMLIKRKVLNKVGLLDEKFTPGNFEDDDLSLRIIMEGYKLLLCLDSYVHHFGSMSFKDSDLKYNELLKINDEKFKEKWGFYSMEAVHLKHELINEISTDVLRKNRVINVLDIGCGLGANLLKIKKIFPNAKVYGIESNREIIKLGKKLSIFDEIQDEEHINLGQTLFDVIIISNEEMITCVNKLVNNFDLNSQIIIANVGRVQNTVEFMKKHMEFNEDIEKAQEYEELGEVDKAIKIYKELIDKEKHNTPKVYFKLGLLLVNTYYIDSNEEKLIEATDFLIKAYNLNYNKEFIINIFIEKFYNPNKDMMKKNYNHNRKYLLDAYESIDIPELNELDFKIIPICEKLILTLHIESKTLNQCKNAPYGMEVLIQLATKDKEQLNFDYINFKIRETKQNEIALNLLKSINLEKESLAKDIFDKIHEYHKLKPECEKYYYMLAKCYLAQGDLNLAESNAKKALEIRKCNIEYNFIMAEIYEKSGNLIGAVRHYTYVMMSGHKKTGINVDSRLNQCLLKASKISQSYLDEVLEEMSSCESILQFFPRKINCFIDQKGALNQKIGIRFGSFFKRRPDREYNKFIGVVNNSYKNNSYENAWILSNNGAFNSYAKVRTEIVNSKIMYENTYVIDSEDIVLPICGTKVNQNVNFQYDNKIDSYVFGVYEFSYLRIDKNVRIYSDDPIIFGKPIKMKHENNRKKLVLDIFVDTLSFDYIRSREYKDIPNIMGYFKDGIIFENNYTCGEYTFPSTACIKTGLSNGKNQMFHDKINIPLNDNIITTAELFNDMGYYCTEITENVEYTEGADKIITQFGYELRANEIVELAISHLESFGETDNYLRLSFLELHRSLEDVAKNLTIQTKNSFEEIFKSDNCLNSVFQTQSYLLLEEYKEDIHIVDRVLGYLFEYIKKNYAEDDIVVSLVSDHGAMLLTEEKFLLKNIHTNTALMVKGSGVPKKGLVKDEVTSAMDLHYILTSLCDIDIDAKKLQCSLPKALGGEGRQYSISESLYPGQTYKLCIRTLDYELRLETKDVTTYDGRINMNQYNYSICERTTGCEVENRDIEKYLLNIVYQHTKNLHDPYYNLSHV